MGEPSPVNAPFPKQRYKPPDQDRGIEPKGAADPLEPIPEPRPDERAAMRLFDRTVDVQYRGMLDAEVENEGEDDGDSTERLRRPGSGKERT